MDRNRDSVFSKEKGTVCGAMYMHGSVTHKLAKACSEVHTVQWCVYHTESVTRHFYEFKNDILDASTTILIYQGNTYLVFPKMKSYAFSS